MKKYLVFIPAIILATGGAGFLLWAQIGTDRIDYPDAKEYAPNFWFDSEENYYPTNPLDFYYDENLNEVAGAEARQKYDNLSEDGKLENFKVYYNTEDSGDELVYQYWLFYVFNDANNEHYGDWESIFVFASPSGEIQKVVASAHNGTESKFILSNDEFLNPRNNSRILVEKGSHANCIDGDEDGLFNRFRDSGNRSSYCFIAFFTWSSTDKLHGLKVEHDSPYYDLRPIEEIKDVFGKKYGEDRPLISKEKSPSLGMVPFKIGKKRIYALPFGGNPPSNAWSKKQFVDSREVLPLTPTRLADNISGFFNNAGSFLAAVGRTMTSPITRLFTANIADNRANRTGSDPVRLGPDIPTLDDIRDGVGGNPGETFTPPILVRGPDLAGSTEGDQSRESTAIDSFTEEPETELVLVTRIIDGDTVELESGQKLRYIGINTPELPNGCFAKKATQKNQELVLNKKVILLQGPTAQDKFGRLLRFVWQDTDSSDTLSDGDVFVNLALVEGGYAYAFDFGEAHAYSHRLEAAETKAKHERQGLWGDTCLRSDLSTEDSAEEDDPEPIVRIYEPPSSIASSSNNNPPTPDETPPDAPVVSIANNTYFNSSSDISSSESGYQINLYGTAESSSTIVIVQNPTYNATTTGGGDWASEVTLLNEGANNFSLTAKDAAGNTSTSTIITLNLDSIAPTTTIAVAEHDIDDDEFEVQWSADAQDLAYFDVQFKIGADGEWQDWATSTLETSKEFEDATTNTYFFRARATDIHENIGEWQVISVVIDLEQEEPEEPEPFLVVINEIQIKNAEFVELYNFSSSTTSLSGYYFSYFPSTRDDWTNPWSTVNKPFPEDAKIPGNGYFLIGLNDYPTSGGNPNSDWDLEFNGGKLANSKGTVAIFPFDPKTATSSESVYEKRADAVGWDNDFDGDSNDISLYEQSPATTTPAAGESLTRDNSHTDTDDNSVDFTVATSTTPTNSKGETYVLPPPPQDTSPVWAMYQKDARHSGLAALSGPTWTSSASTSLAWTFEMKEGQNPEGARSQPVIASDEVVYVTSALGKVYAINPDGSQKWKFNPRNESGVGDGWADASPALSPDGTRVYSVYTDNARKKLRLFSIDTRDGSSDWKYSIAGGNHSFTSPILDSSGNIYVASRSKLYSISPSGSLRWEFTPYSVFGSSPMWIKMPAISKENGEEYAYITSKITNNPSDRYIWKLKASDGSEVWKRNPTGNNALFNGVSINATGTIYTGGYLNLGTSGLFAVDPRDGSKIWSNNAGDSVGINIPSFDAEGNIFLGTDHRGNSGALHKINATGTVMWRFNPDASPSAVQYPAVVDAQGRIYVGAKNKYVYALDPEDGAIIWKYQLSDEPRGFAVANGRVYVVGHEGKIYAFGQ